MPRPGYLLLLLALARPTGADVNPDMLDAFRLHGSPPLHGFQEAPAGADRAGPIFERPPGARAALNVSAFHGPSEIRYSILLFPSRQALQTWDLAAARDMPAWFSPLRAAPGPDGTRESRLGGPVNPAGPHSYAAVVSRVVIVVWGFPHPEKIRRDPSASRKALPPAEFQKRVERVKAALIQRAREHPENQGP